ncbi:MAG TPA: hypothetical protein VGP48_10395 [Stellaceae bacterium]|nr:hypothetical protein [Stellaceae bacterium]
MSELYRQQAERAKQLARTVSTPEARLELLEIAARFRKLAEFSVAVAANSNREAAADPKSA